MKIAVLTLGCKVNYYESEKLIREFRERGCDIVEFTDEADIYLINTCTVTHIADRKSRQMIHRAKNKAPHAMVVAVGCYVDGTKDLPDVDLAIGNRDKPEAVSKVLDHWKRLHPETVSAGAGSEDRFCSDQDGTDGHHHRTRAFIKVQDGCNQYCTYCLIPYVRGMMRSTPPEEVVSEISERVRAGCTEVVLTGIHLSSYGVDCRQADGFVRAEGAPLLDLIRQVNEIPGLQRIRLGSLEPRIITEKWLQNVADAEKLCPHFHLSLQSGCDETLRRMNRHYTTGEYLDKVRLLRSFFDEPAITADVITGFPGETEEEFACTEAFLEETGFADLHVFQYSPREGTVAASFENQVPPPVRRKRSEILIGRLDGWQKDYRERVRELPERILLEEVVARDGKRWLSGYSERYIRYGAEVHEAEARGWRPGMTVPCDRNLFLNL